MRTPHLNVAAALCLVACDNKVNDDVMNDTDGLNAVPSLEDTGTQEIDEDRDTGDSAQNIVQDATDVLAENCYACHGQGGSASGGFDYVRDTERLITTGKIVPGDAAGSPLFQRMETRSMPPAGVEPRPSDDDVELIQIWIDETLVTEDPDPGRTFVTIDDEFAAMKDDVLLLPASRRRFIRYISLTHLYNANVLDEELETHRRAISKLINMLSWAPIVAAPVPIDSPRNTIFRIDLTDYAWDNGSSQDVSPLWDTLIDANPYAVLPVDTPDALEVITQTRTPVPWVRGDWFASTAARAPLYYELLMLPDTIDELESSLLLVDTASTIERLTAVRSGFNESGVSTNNRIIERHTTVFGAYWKSYDFSANIGLQNIFEHPLGPGDDPADFQSAGGEMIWELPNDLQAYFLADAEGTRIDEAPIEIVSDPGQPDRAVVGGLSCISCHSEGYIAKRDEIRANVEANEDAFTTADFERIMGLYVEPSTFDALLEGDKDRFGDALLRTGNSAADPDPILSLSREFESNLDRRRAAAELGMTREQLSDALEDEDVADLLSALRSDSGTIQREVFELVYPDVACLIGYGLPLTPVEDCEPADYEIFRVASDPEVTRDVQDRVEPLPGELDE
jgi:hypothetical protein